VDRAESYTPAHWASHSGGRASDRAQHSEQKIGEGHAAPLALGSVCLGRGERRRSRRSGCAFLDDIQFGYRRSNPDFFQVLICQVRQNGNIDIILGKARGVLSETELLKQAPQPAASRPRLTHFEWHGTPTNR
jgi:hypothetical protein